MGSKVGRRACAIGTFVLLGLVSLHAAAQSADVKPEDEYKKKIRVTDDIQPLGETPFGENLSLYNGTLSFSQTDVRADGTGPSIELTRSFRIPDVDPNFTYQEFIDNALVDWTLDVPHIETLSAKYSWSDVNGQLHTGWFFRDSLSRCSSLATAPDIVVSTGLSDPVTYNSADWWHGYQMILPGAGAQDLMRRSASNIASPQMTVPGTSSTTFPIVTKSQWAIGCLAQTSNGQPGEGFFAVSPSGTKYWFDWLTYKAADSMVMTGGGSLHRQVDFMLVSRVEDRFGNSVTYSYDANSNLTAVMGSDGRNLALGYDTWQRPGIDPSGNYYSPLAHRLRTATLQPDSPQSRTWTYNYSNDPYLPRLTSVQLPDASAWSFNLGGFRASSLDNLVISPEGGGCIGVAGQVGGSSIGTITHPSGLVGTFTVTTTLRGRSYTPNTCIQAPSGDFTLIPNVYSVAALTKKTFTGAGSPDRVWQYVYSPANQSRLEDCASGCVGVVWTDVIAPDNQATRSTFSNRYDSTDTLLLREDIYAQAVGSTLIQSNINEYASFDFGPWPSRFGVNPQRRLNDDQLETQSPQRKRQIQREGDTYTWEALAFNQFAQPTHTKRFNSITGQQAVDDYLTYLNETRLWVLGLPLTRVSANNGTNEAVSESVYDVPDSSHPDGKDTLKERKRFGQSVVSYSFDSAGQLASFTDGNSHTTTLTNYKRGIPQFVTYPDLTTQHIAVDDLGQISSITDQVSNTTGFTYDAVGRLASITYPTEAGHAWFPKIFTYEFVPSERGLTGNHWRRTISKGASRSVTIFDAYLRPVLSDTFINGVAGSLSTAETRYDWKGQSVFQSYLDDTASNIGGYAGGLTTQYDALGRVTAVIQTSELGNLTSTTEYLSGARKKVTDPKGYVTITSYQVFDTPSLDTVIGVQAPEGINQSITRDVYGNPLEIRQWGTGGGLTVDISKRLYYDGYHRLCRTKEPESGGEMTAYDGANNVAWTASGLSIDGDGCGSAAEGAKTFRMYDAMNRVRTLTPPAGTPGTTYTYDALGNVQSSVTSDGTSWTGSRNSLGLLTSEQLGVTNNGVNAVTYAYDDYGSVRSISYPDATVVDYAPDPLGRPTKAGIYATGVHYYPDGDVKNFVFGNGVIYTVDKNARQLLSNFSYGSSGPVLSKDYAYDANGNIMAITDLLDGTHTKTMTYDQLNRLSSATSSLWNGVESYTYDPLNNIRSRLSSGQTFTYNYDGTNRLASITQGTGSFMTLGYDARGNVINKKGNTLVFNDKNQLTAIPGFGTYAYDASGRRVVKSRPDGSATYYFYTQSGQLMYSLDTGTAKEASYIYLGKKMIARNDTLKLAAPSAISFDSNPNNGRYTVSWTASPAATSYQLDESREGGGWTTLSGTLTGTSYVITSKEGGGYGYRVRSCASGQCTAWTSSSNLGVTPTLPGISVPTLTNVTFDVSWTMPISATTYDVQEQVNGGSWTTVVSNTAATQLSRTVAISGSYLYRVQAKNIYGSRGWVTSMAFTVDSTYGVVPIAPAALNVPSTSYTDSTAISWSSVADVNRYVLERSSDGGTTWGAAYDGTATNAAVNGLAAGVHTFRVRACNSYNCSAWKSSTNLVVTLAPNGTPTLTAPGGSINGAYTIGWSTVSAATNYTLQESFNGGAWTQVQANGNTSWAASGKGNGSYAYRVQACNVAGCGLWSSTGATTVLLPPPAPTSVTAPVTAYGAFTVSWAAAPTATAYQVYQSFNGGAKALVYNGSAMSLTVAPSSSGTYGYSVYAANASGSSATSRESGNVVTVTLAPTLAPSISVPANSINGSYTVNWSGVSGATSYTLQEQFNGGAWGNVQANGSTSWGASGKGTGIYGYRIQACNVGGCGPWSSVGTTAVLLPPITPTGLAVTVSGTVDKPVVHLSWNASANATTYNLEETHPQDGVFILYSGPNTSAGMLTYANGQVRFRVQACNSSGCSAWSAYASTWLDSGSG
ncbi:MULTISPECIES: RHS repeat protein [Dyella]|uniref:RHS repeat protein n=2 Tax=Dyella TaxID=231454 RepID=A0A4R0YUM5_9GAMM|nr:MULTISPECIES: RHS repeat protein [Dyella]TBR39411.1 RHS repeat protein [Dyella terrae]TCI13002.1 RHS repeat protein [Dyella soli]